MPKRQRTIEPAWFYRRVSTNTVYARDRQGRYHCYRLDNGRVRVLPGGITSLGPIYGRVDFSNGIRFTGRTRSQILLAARFNATPLAQKITTDWFSLPLTRETGRRTSNQGMNTAMLNLTGAAHSATQYAGWFNGRHPGAGVNPAGQWEWCHLKAHSMGGADNATNIVAAMRGNNSEQLAIESALQMYRCEAVFEMRISAACVGSGDGRHLGDVICYEVRCTFGGANFVQYLDCLHAPNPSQIHYYSILESVATWANQKLVYISHQVYGNNVSARDQNLITDYS